MRAGEARPIGYGIGELCAAIVIGLYTVGDPDGWGRDRLAFARRALLWVHGLLVFAGLELLLWQAELRPGWLAVASRGLNALAFPVLAFALVKAFPSRLGPMLETTLAPALYGALIALSARLLGGRDLAGLAAGGWLREELLLLCLPLFLAAAAALSLLLAARLREGAVGLGAALRRALGTLRDEPFFALFWIVLLAIWWTQVGFAAVRLVQGMADEPWPAIASCAVETALAGWRLTAVMRRAIPTGV